MTSSNINITREYCGKCTRQIYIGQPAIVCSKCDSIFHSKCLKEYTIFRQNIYCSVCVDKYDIVRYNPYFNSLQRNDHDDRFYDSDVNDYTDVFEVFSFRFC